MNWIRQAAVGPVGEKARSVKLKVSKRAAAWTGVRYPPLPLGVSAPRDKTHGAGISCQVHMNSYLSVVKEGQNEIWQI